MSDIVGGKGISLHQRGGVRELTHVRVFECDGSNGATYLVVLGARGARCNCEAGRNGRRCYHAVAARLRAAADRRGDGEG